MRLIDADVFAAEMKKRQDACKSWRKRAIDRDDIHVRLYAEQALATFIEAKLTLDKMPTVDAIPIVRCSECRKYNDGICALDNTLWDADDFCSYGERREDGNA